MDCKRSRRSHESAWRWLREAFQPDIVLTQETVLLPTDAGQFVWKEDGIDKSRRWSSAVVSFGPPIEEIQRWRGRANKSEHDLRASAPGTLAIAMVELPPQDPIAVVSMYGKFDNGYVTTTVHQQLNDLYPLLDSSQGKRVIIGGDLNLSTQFEPPYSGIHRNIFERFEVNGLVNLTQATRDQRPSLDDCPCEEGPECGHVQTLRHPKSEKPWQNDYIYASQSLARKVTACTVVDKGSPSPWDFSDHCPVVAAFDL